jgi:hypothetical protein
MNRQSGWTSVVFGLCLSTYTYSKARFVGPTIDRDESILGARVGALLWWQWDWGSLAPPRGLDTFVRLMDEG